MKIYISADMEGATGVTAVCQTHHKDAEYDFGCRMQQHDVLAAVEGALEGGTSEVLVNDAHARMINLDVSAFGSNVRLLSGTPKALGMMEGCEGADGAFFVGYHAMAGTEWAVLDHTISGATVFAIELNGQPAGETALNASVCAELGIPVALVTGDMAACAEAVQLLGPSLKAAPVKEAHGRTAASCLTPALTRQMIFDYAKYAVANVRDGSAPMMDIGDGTFDLRMTFHTTSQADNAAVLPEVERLDGHTVRVTGSSMVNMRRWAGGLISLASR